MIRTGVGLVFIVIALAFQLKMISVFRQMKTEVNEKLSPEQRIPEIGLSLLRGKVIKLHRKMWPLSNARRTLYLLWACEMIAFLIGAFSIIQIDWSPHRGNTPVHLDHRHAK
jgi:hypothetical protein